MFTTRFVHHSAAILLILAMLFAPMSVGKAAVTEYTSYTLGRIQWQTMNGWANAEQGGLRVLGAQADSKGGFYFVQSVKNGCRWKFSWSFGQDVSQISNSRGEIQVFFRIESDGGTCYNNFNPFVEFLTDGDPTAPVYGPQDSFRGRFCLQPGGFCNQNPERRFTVYRQTSVKPNALFTIQIIGPNFGNDYGLHGLHVTYTYAGLTGGSGPVTSPTIGLTGTQWQECETYSQAICGYWAFGSDGQGRGQWGGVQAALSIAVNGRDVTVTRRDRTSSLQATYRGTLSADGTQITGRVDWCCDGLGNRSGTWRAQILGVRR